ncbi:hypothetical protein HMPREF0083_01951 [Aneurinibacillus aneurinilyticus ATCC 12856]|uniref:Uncharacterized protein n=1 Tax=Aneurinibacillus aneurinilyticus ATCC 12856 TaxID=649747 RepID=U1X645_ANEAE|nr:hypothetical protein HMPREF0083_01951 [Aneurinibacillus aneurinilyticus ATCC 12856]
MFVAYSTIKTAVMCKNFWRKFNLLYSLNTNPPHYKIIQY